MNGDLTNTLCATTREVGDLSHFLEGSEHDRLVGSAAQQLEISPHCTYYTGRQIDQRREKEGEGLDGRKEVDYR